MEVKLIPAEQHTQVCSPIAILGPTTSISHTPGLGALCCPMRPWHTCFHLMSAPVEGNEQSDSLEWVIEQSMSRMLSLSS